jgi:hypothetical protein
MLIVADKSGLLQVGRAGGSRWDKAALESAKKASYLAQATLLNWMKEEEVGLPHRSYADIERFALLQAIGLPGFDI